MLWVIIQYHIIYFVAQIIPASLGPYFLDRFIFLLGINGDNLGWKYGSLNGTQFKEAPKRSVIKISNIF